MMNEILNNITTQYQVATISWYNTLFPMANHLFAALAVIEIAWSGIWWAIDKQELNSLWNEFLKRIVIIGFFYAVLLHANAWIPGIIKSFMLIGSQASHIDKLDPSSIFSQGISIASRVLAPLEQKNLFSAALPFLVGGVTALVVVISFAIIAAELVVTLIESYLVIGAGILFLGFGSSRWTSGLTLKFLNYAVNVGCKLFFLYLIIGVGANMASQWGAMVEQGGLDNITPFFEVLAGALVFVFITWTIPNKAASLMSGSIGASLSGVMSTTSMLNHAAHSATQSFPANLAKGGVNKGLETLKKIVEPTQR